MRFVKRVTFFLSIFISALCNGQTQMDSIRVEKPSTAEKEDQYNEFLVTAILEYNIPQGDYGKRFNPHLGVGAGFYWKSKTDFYLGLDFVTYFSDNIKETGVIENMLTSGGYVIGGDGTPADIQISQRGFNFNFVKFGKLLIPSRFWRGNQHSGLVGMLGVGLLQHKIRMVDNSGTVPGLTKEYLKGYDKLSNGFSLSPMLGYFYYDEQKYLNFFIAVEYKIAWTQNRRDWNHIDMMKEDGIRDDRSLTFKIGWFFPIRARKSRDYYYF